MLVASGTLRTECHRDSLGCFCMCADVGKIPVNGHAESANEGLSDRSQVGLRGMMCTWPAVYRTIGCKRKTPSLARGSS